MKALVYHGPGNKSWEEVPDPKIIDPTDVIVQVDTTTICGTDLHILHGNVPAVTPGRILGHEAVGTITEIGGAVNDLAVGDRVLVPAVTSCGRCSYCKKQMPSHCQSVGGIGWIFGHLIDGTQAEYVRVPFAETSVHKMPEGVRDDQAIYVADILPTGYEVGVVAGNVQPGDVVAVIGSGPVGLGAMITAGLHGASRVIAIDLDDNRIEAAQKLGATHGINSGKDGWEDEVRALTDGLGVDVAIEAVGIPATFEAACRLVRPGGNIANAGVHGKAVSLPLQDMWIENVTLTMGLVDCRTVPELLRMVAEGKLPIDALTTHRFKLDQMMEAYDVFSNAAEHKTLKVILER